MLLPKDSDISVFLGMMCNAPVHKHLAGHIHKLFASEEDSLIPQNGASHEDQNLDFNVLQDIYLFCGNKFHD
jgi:hypothetical protein